MKAYLFWYMLYNNQPSEKVYIIASSEEQAIKFWFWYLKRSIGFVFDYGYDPILVVDQKDFRKDHTIGDILGQNVTL